MTHYIVFVYEKDELFCISRDYPTPESAERRAEWHKSHGYETKIITERD